MSFSSLSFWGCRTDERADSDPNGQTDSATTSIATTDPYSPSDSNIIKDGGNSDRLDAGPDTGGGDNGCAVAEEPGSDTDTVSARDSETGTVSDTATASWTTPDTDTSSDTERETATLPATETSGDTISDTGSDTYADTVSAETTAYDSALGTEDATDTGGETDAPGETDTGGETDAVEETDTGSSPIADTASASDTSPISTCPDDMVPIPANADLGVPSAFCIDRFEASRQDATATSGGTDDTVALSRAGVIPWFENPMTAAALTRYQNACLAAQKRICTREEWFFSCRGSAETTYVYGDTFDPEICNSVDTYCDDYCASEGIPVEECNTSANCGYSCGRDGEGGSCFHVDPTGSYPGCTNEFGTFDVNGNVWEVVPSTDDSRGYEVRGGAFNCASAAARFYCNYNAGWDALYAGFRCCKDLQ
jgi:hypothetical protein